MIDREALDDYDRELSRVVDRLRSMPITRLSAAVEPCRTAAQALLSLSSSLGDPAPCPLPKVQPVGLGDQIAVLGHDLRDVTLDRGDTGRLTEATSVLADLRHHLA